VPTAYAVDTNIAQGKSAAQSSTYTSAAASKAVDGNTNNSWSGGSISATEDNTGEKSWWQVDLGSVSNISSVKIFNRTGDGSSAKNKLKNYYVIVSSVPFPAGNVDPTSITGYEWRQFNSAVAEHPTTFNLSSVTGRYVRVQLNTDNVILNMSEVEVWGTSSTPPPAESFPATSPNALTTGYQDLEYGMFISYGMPTFYGTGSGATNVSIEQCTAYTNGVCGAAQASSWAPTGSNTSADTDQWIQLAKDSEMNYAILTVHHNQGFLLWDSAHTSFDVGNATGTDDVVASFVTSAKNENMPFGFYLNAGIDIHHWGWDTNRKMTDSAYEAYFEDIIEELLVTYPDTGFLWFDQPQQHPNIGALYDHIKSINPNVVVIHNAGLGANSIATDKYDVADWETIHFGDDRLITGNRDYSANTTISGTNYHIPKGGIGTMITDWFWWGNNVSRPADELEAHYNHVVVNKSSNLLVSVAPNQTGQIPSAQVNAIGEATTNLFGTPPSGNNVAQGKSATQSSSPYGVATAEKAVDGNTNGTYVGGSTSNSVSITGNNTNAWWQVDLGSVENNISIVEVWNRVGGTGTSNFYVFVSDVPFTSTNLNTTLAQTGVSSYYTSSTAGRPTSVNVGRSGRYVRVQLAGTGAIAVGEVKVFD